MSKKIATVSPVYGCSVEELRSLARLAEKGGFEAIFSPEVPPFSSLANAQVFSEVTEKIKVGTWIANIYMRHPVMATASALTIQEITKGRMILGLGVSHAPVNQRFGIDMGNPLEKMRGYVREVKSYADGSSEKLSIKRNVSPFPVYIAGLTKGAANLAGEEADGLMPYLCPPQYVKKLKDYVDEGAKKKKRNSSEIKITNGIPSFISEDEGAAIEYAKKGLSPYLRLPFYQRLVRNIGYGDVVDKINEGIKPFEAMSDELVMDVALVGTPSQCKERLKAYFDVGVDLAIIVPGPVGKQNPVEVMEVTVETYS